MVNNRYGLADLARLLDVKQTQALSTLQKTAQVWKR